MTAAAHPTADTAVAGPAPVRARRSAIEILACGAWFGLTMTAFVWFVPGHPYRAQVIASAVKVPLLLFLVVLLAYVPTYAADRLAGPPLGAARLWRLLLRSTSATARTLVPAGVILLAFSATRNYSAVVLASYASFAIAGVVGVRAFARAVNRATAASPRRRRAVVITWAIAFGMIGAQLGWSLRPFVGWTGMPFTLVRADAGHIYQQIYWEIWNLAHGGGAGFPPG